jgi:P4 family phage/plasmid primase-like protien
MFDKTDSLFSDVPPENVIDIPADEVSAQWGKFPPGMTAPPWQADWLYVAGSKEEAAHIESFDLPAVCHEELGPEQIPILQNADVVLLNRGRELDDAFALVARQMRSVDIPNLVSCSKEEFTRLTKPHWERRDPTPEGARSSEDDISFLPPDIVPPDAPREPEAEPPATEVEPAPESKPEPERAVTEPQQELPPGEKPTTRDQQPPTPNRDQIEMLVLALFKHATPGNWVSLRSFFEGRANLPPFRITPHKLNGDLNVLIDLAFREAELAAHAREKIVFCPPTATFTNNKHAREVDLAEGLVLNTECDAHPQAARRKLEELLGPATVVVESGGVWTNPKTGEIEPKLHVHHRLKAPAGSKDEQNKLKLARKLAAKIAGGDPSNVPLVHPIRWPGSVHRKGEPKLCRIVALNSDAEIGLATALAILQEAAKANGMAEHRDPEPDKGNEHPQFPPLPFAPIKEGCPWLRHVHDMGGADQTEVLWRDALRISGFLEGGETLRHEFGNKHAGYDFADTEAKYDLARKAKKDKDLGWPLCKTIHEHGSAHCETCPHLVKGKSPIHLALPSLDNEHDIAPPFSEEALALVFAEQHANTLRHVAKWGQWYIWDGTCWRMDETRQVFTLAREVCREAARKPNKASERRRIASAKTRAAVVSLASEDQRQAAITEQWDADPWLLNTPDGVVDLRTGKLREHQAAEYMTMQTAVSPAGDCPRWKKFMREITGGDEELQKYLQRVDGYSLTGVTIEQELYFGYGPGNNGMGVWTRTIAGILHDYHRPTSIETFTVAKFERHPTELAGLRGVRLVTAAETEEGRRWAEARIKEMTGGDEISARFMRQDFFEFFPQFKLRFTGNHMPILRTINKAITRRFNRIPFVVTIPDERINKHLEDELKAEWPGILAWAIEGCLEWQRIGMCPPKAVIDATESYLESEDIIGEWIDECCERDPNAWESSTALFNSWKGYAIRREEWVGSEKTFCAKLEDRGEFKRQRNKEQTKRGFAGLRLKTAAEKGAAEKGAAETAAKISKLIPLR